MMWVIYFNLTMPIISDLPPGYVDIEKEVDGGGGGDDAVRVDHTQHGEGSRQLVGQEGEKQICMNRTIIFQSCQ